MSMIVMWSLIWRNTRQVGRILVGNVLWRHVFQRVENEDTIHVSNVFKTCLKIEERHPWFGQPICLRQMPSKTCLHHVLSLYMELLALYCDVYALIIIKCWKNFCKPSILTFFFMRSFNFNRFNRSNTLFASCELRACVTISRMGGDERWLVICGP